MIECATVRSATNKPIVSEELTSRLQVLSSSALGWRDIEAQAYLEPMQLEGWVEPVVPDVTVMLLVRGTMRLEHQHAISTCSGFQLQPGDLLLKPANSVAPALRWRSLSAEPMHTLHVQLSSTLFRRTVEELAGRDPTQIELVGQAGFQDPLLLHIGLALGRELEAPSAIGPLYAQTAAHMLAVHLLRHYAVAPVVIRARRQGLSPRHIQRVTEYVQTHLSQPLSLEELAQQTGFSPYHFARLFRQTIWRG